MAKMTDDDIVTRLANAAGQAVGFSDSKLSRERSLALRYFEGERPYKSSAADTGYVSMDVMNSVEAMKAQLLETFSGNHRPINFLSQPGEDDSVGQARTDWVNNVIFEQNRGFSIFQTLIDDGLMYRAGIVKVYWKNDVRTVAYDVADTTWEAVQAHIGANPHHEIDDYTVTEDGTAIKRVRFTEQKDQSRIQIDTVPPEEFGISAMSKSLDDADVLFHRRSMTMSDLIRMGYPKDAIADLAAADSDVDEDGRGTDKYNRFNETDDFLREGDAGLSGPGSDATRRYQVYECYTQLDVDDSGTARLYKVTYSGSTLLDKEPVERHPFVAFVPLARPHAFWGGNFSKLLHHTQNARTYLMRSVVNHANITNNPRLLVQTGALMNPKELMENRAGGIVNVRRIDQVAPLVQAGLNPFVFQSLDALASEKEQITGISELSQGLNKDAISTQNSQGMVEQLISMSQVRQKIIARNFAENCLVPLATLIYKLTIENEPTAKMMNVCGTWQAVDFSTWPEENEVEVSMTLGYGETAKEVQKWIGIHNLLSQPQLSQFYPDDKKFAVISKAMMLSGIRNVKDYILSPDQIQPPAPDPMHQADLAVKQADAAVKNANAQAAVENTKLKTQEVAAKQQEGQTKAQATQAKADSADQQHTDKTNLDMMKFQHLVAVDAAELVLQNKALEQQKLTASAEPKG